MRLLSFAFALALLIGLATAAPAADLSAYRTYGWTPRKTTAQRAPVLDQVQAAIDRQMAERGYVLAAKPDVIVVFSVSAREREEAVGASVHTVPTPYGPMIVGKQQDQKTVNEGTLTLQMIDARTRRPVYRAVATERLSPRGADARAIDRAVKEALAGLPVRR